MKTTFHIGSLSICYPQGVPHPLERFDAIFQKPVLPSQRTVEVELREVDRLEIPAGTPERWDNMLLWNDGTKETRLYRTHLEEKYLMSCLEDDRVTISVTSGKWTQYRQRFRPWPHIHLERLLLENDALVLHSASIIAGGKAIAFTAPSGTGKSTQTDLWHKYAEGVEDLNGDRTLLQKTEKGWYACGFPIYGSSVRCAQRAVPIDAIVVIRRGSKDRVRELSPLEKVSLLYSEIPVPIADPRAIHRAMDLLEDLIQHTTVVQLECTMERSAVDTLRAFLNERK